VFTQPALIYQGRADSSVDPHTVEAFAQTPTERHADAARRRSSTHRGACRDVVGIQSFLGLTTP
jgi:hypothetical protein